ncbi:hypothetical protein GCM10027047_39120 [Rhodococcus aerolatus]
MRTTAADLIDVTSPAVIVGECAAPNRHLMVVMTVEPTSAAGLRTAVAGVLERDGLWCGPAAATPRCRAGLLELVVTGGVSAEVIDAADYDDPGQARAACLVQVAGLADAAGVVRVVFARDDACAAADSAGSGELAHRAGVSPALRCEHADIVDEPLTVLAEVLVRCWAQGGAARRGLASVFIAAHVV